MLSVALKPAWQLAILLCLSHFGAILCLLSLPLDWSIKIALLVLCFASLCFTFQRYILLRSPRSILKISQHSDGEWRLYNRYGDEIRATLHSASVKTSYFMLLNFSCVDRYCHYQVIIIPNSRSVGEFRRLQIALFQ